MSGFGGHGKLGASNLIAVPLTGAGTLTALAYPVPPPPDRIYIAPPNNRVITA